MRLDHRLLFALRVLRDRDGIFGNDAEVLADAIEETLEILEWPEEPLPPYETAQQLWHEHLMGPIEPHADQTSADLGANRRSEAP